MGRGHLSESSSLQTAHTSDSLDLAVAGVVSRETGRQYFSAEQILLRHTSAVLSLMHEDAYRRSRFANLEGHNTANGSLCRVKEPDAIRGKVRHSCAPCRGLQEHWVQVRRPGMFRSFPYSAGKSSRCPSTQLPFRFCPFTLRNPICLVIFALCGRAHPITQ